MVGYDFVFVYVVFEVVVCEYNCDFVVMVQWVYVVVQLVSYFFVWGDYFYMLILVDQVILIVVCYENVMFLVILMMFKVEVLEYLGCGEEVQVIRLDSMVWV